MRFRRIVFGLGSESSAPALAVATDLAPATDATLLGLFVEEHDLLQLAALPFAREISFPAAPGRSLDPASMQRALRARANAARDTLARSLAGRSIEWRFEVVRGSALSAVLEVAGDSDLAVISLAAGAMVDADRRREAALRGLKGVRRPVLLVGERAAPRAPIVAVLTADAVARKTVAALGALARHYGSGLSILVLPPAVPDADLLEALDRLGVSARIRALPDASPERLVDEISRERPGLLVLCGDGLAWDAGQMLVRRADCPLLLLPAAPG